MSYSKLAVRYYPGGDTGEVNDFLKTLAGNAQRRGAAARLEIDIMTLANFWPQHMNVTVRTLRGWEPLQEIKRLHAGIAYRIFFTVRESQMWLLSAFEKKSKKTPASELKKAYDRMRQLRQGAI